MGKISTRSLRRIRTIEDLDIASARVRLELSRRSDAVSENVEGIRSLFRPVNLFAQGLNMVSRRTPLAQMLLGGVRQLKARLTK